MGRGPCEVSLHFLPLPAPLEGLRLVPVLPGPKGFSGASTWGSQGLAAAERGCSVQTTGSFTGPRFRRGPMLRAGAGLSHSLGDQERVTHLGTDLTLHSRPHPVFSHEFLLSKQQHLCILKSQMLVLNVPTSERKHIAFSPATQGRKPRLCSPLRTGLLGAGPRLREAPENRQWGSAAVHFRSLFVYKCF